jgi:hypothetical protein
MVGGAGDSAVLAIYIRKRAISISRQSNEEYYQAASKRFGLEQALALLLSNLTEVRETVPGPGVPFPKGVSANPGGQISSIKRFEMRRSNMASLGECIKFSRSQ